MIGETGIIIPKRSIGGVIANVTVEEVGNDAVEITQHPVEKTAAITDHAYPLPARLQVTVGWSPSGSGGGGAIPDAGDPSPLQSIYDQFLAMKDARDPIEVQTGKRLYKDMLIKAITLVTNVDTENALFLTMELQQLLFAQTQTVTVPPNNVQQQPQKTANTLNAGTKNAAPAAVFTIAGEPVDPKYLQ